MFLSDLFPVCAETGAGRLLVALQHCTPGILVGVLVDFLEESIECLLALRLLFVLDFGANFVPVFCLLGR